MKFWIEINKDTCKGCSLCIPECPKKVIEMGDKFNSKGWRYALPVRNDDCIGCKKCAVACPDVAIKVLKGED